jgi:hypothetical protein
LSILNPFSFFFLSFSPPVPILFLWVPAATKKYKTNFSKICSQLYNSQPLLTTHLSSRLHEGLVSHPDNFPYSSSITPLLLLLLLLRPPFSVTEEESQPTSQPIPPPTKRSSKNPSIDLCNVFQKWVYESNLCMSGSESGSQCL